MAKIAVGWSKRATTTPGRRTSPGRGELGRRRERWGCPWHNIPRSRSPSRRARWPPPPPWGSASPGRSCCPPPPRASPPLSPVEPGLWVQTNSRSCQDKQHCTRGERRLQRQESTSPWLGSLPRNFRLCPGCPDWSWTFPPEEDDLDYTPTPMDTHCEFSMVHLIHRAFVFATEVVIEELRDDGCLPNLGQKNLLDWLCRQPNNFKLLEIKGNPRSQLREWEPCRRTCQDPPTRELTLASRCCPRCLGLCSPFVKSISFWTSEILCFTSYKYPNVVYVERRTWAISSFCGCFAEIFVRMFLL